MPKQDLCRVPKYRAGGENHSAPLSCSPCPAVSSTFPFQRSKENRQFSLGLRTQGTLKQQVPRGQLQIFKLLLSPLVLKRASLSQWGGKWVPDPVNLAGWGALRQQWSPHPGGSWRTLPSLPPALRIFTAPKIASLEGGVGEVLSSSFAPSHSVFTALSLSLSLATWFCCQALLPCLHPRHWLFQVPGPSGREGDSLSSDHPVGHLAPPSCGCPITPRPLWDRSTFCFKASLIFHFC